MRGYIRVIIALATPFLIAALSWLLVKMNFTSTVSVGFILFIVVLVYGWVNFGHKFKLNDEGIAVLILSLFLGVVILFPLTAFAAVGAIYGLQESTHEFIKGLYIFSPACVIAYICTLILGLALKDKRLAKND